MRKITSEAVNAFFSGKDYKKGNTKITCNYLGHFHHFYLHGKLIASRMDNINGVRFNTLDKPEHHSRTTCERLNGIMAHIRTIGYNKNLGRFHLKNGRIHYVVDGRWMEYSDAMWTWTN